MRKTLRKKLNQQHYIICKRIYTLSVRKNQRSVKKNEKIFLNISDSDDFSKKVIRFKTSVVSQMLSWKVVTILLLFSSLGSLVPVPGKHFLIETEDEAADEPEMEGRICD